MSECPRFIQRSVLMMLRHELDVYFLDRFRKTPFVKLHCILACPEAGPCGKYRFEWHDEGIRIIALSYRAPLDVP